MILVACDSESAPDCLQTTGDIEEFIVSVDAFDRIRVDRDIKLVVASGEAYDVKVSTGANLYNDIEVRVIEGQLVLTDNNTCNYVRSYGNTTVYVTAPNITEILQSSQYEIKSSGTLHFPRLTLISEDFNNSGTFTVGDFRLAIDADNLRITSNNLSSFYIRGAADQVFIGFYSGSGRFEGAELRAERIEVFHRGSNDMIVYPLQELDGELRSTGNLIVKNRPPIVEVEQFFTGRLIFDD